MKKLLLLLTLLLMLSIPSYAAESDISDHNIYTRVYEYIEENSQTINLGANIALFALMFYSKYKHAKSSKLISSDLTSVKADSSAALDGQEAVVGAVNMMIETHNTMSDGYAKMKEACEAYGRSEADRNHVVAALSEQVSCVLEILSIVYANNKNIPQGIKDLVNVKYAKCLTALEDNDQLQACIEKLRVDVQTEEGAASENQT